MIDGPISLDQLEKDLSDVNEITKLLCWEIVSDGKRLIDFAESLDKQLFDYMAKAGMADALAEALSIEDAPACDISSNDDMQIMALSAAITDFCEYMKDRQQERKKGLDETLI